MQAPKGSLRRVTGACLGTRAGRLVAAGGWAAASAPARAAACASSASDRSSHGSRSSRLLLAAAVWCKPRRMPWARVWAAGGLLNLAACVMRRARRSSGPSSSMSRPVQHAQLWN